jgi:Tfp pilus assembly protein PilV
MTRLPRQRATRRSERGFSLAEVIIASAVLLFILVGVTQLSIYQARAALRTVMNAEVPHFAQSMIEMSVAYGYCAMADSVLSNNTNGPITTGAAYVTGSTTAPAIGNVYNSTTQNYTLNARTITGTIQVTDTNGSASAKLGSDPLLITATLTWVDPTRNRPCTTATQCGANQVCCDSTSPYPTCPPTDSNGQCLELYVQQEYLSPPPTTSTAAPPPCP